MELGKSTIRLICPSGMCQADNDIYSEACVRCGLPLRGLARVSIYTSLLFNMGLSKAKSNQFSCARDLFAAVVHWCPKDSEARNALAMACFAIGDEIEARYHWETVLKQSQADAIAVRGLATIENLKKARETNEAKQHNKSKMKYGKLKKRRNKS